MGGKWHHDASHIALIIQFFSLSARSECHGCQDQTGVQINTQSNPISTSENVAARGARDAAEPSKLLYQTSEARMSDVQNPSDIPLY